MLAGRDRSSFRIRLVDFDWLIVLAGVVSSYDFRRCYHMFGRLFVVDWLWSTLNFVGCPRSTAFPRYCLPRMLNQLIVLMSWI